MNDDWMFAPPNPDKDKYLSSKLRPLLNEIKSLSKNLGLDASQTLEFRHATYYLNLLIDDWAVPEDSGQIFEAIRRIQDEEIPNTPIASFNNQQLPLEVLRQNAMLLLAKGIIRGLSESEINLLSNTLRILLEESQLQPALETIEKLRKNESNTIIYPVNPDTLQSFWEINRRRLAA